MSTFHQLLRPTEHKDVYNRPVYWVASTTLDSNGHPLYLHNDGKVKDGMMHIGQPCTTCEFVTLDKAYLAINDYYVANGQTTPFVRVGGKWSECAGAYHGHGQTSPDVVYSGKSQTMVFE